MYDILIKNAKIIDGTGAKITKSNILINQGIIEFISKDTDYKTKITIDADNLLLTPGFIDVNNHSDTSLTIFNQSKLKSLASQGITTIIGGNCGGSLAPLSGIDSLKSIQKWTNLSKININWNSVKEYYEILEKNKLYLNYSTLIGYSTVRRGLLKDEIRPLLDTELDYIQKFIERGLNQGALGVSVGLSFTHSHLIDKTELLLLAQILKKHKKILTFHLRDESEHIIGAIQEVIDIVRQTGVNTEISHLKILGKKNWKYFDEVYNMLSHTIDQDKLPIKFDIFPYNYNNGVLYIHLPKWLTKNGRYDMLKELHNIEVRKKVIAEMKMNNVDYSSMVISQFREGKNFVKKTIQEISKNQEVSIEESILNLIIASEGGVKVMINSINDIHIKKFIINKNSIISTDGVGYDDTFFEKNLYDHPRCFYSMPKYINNYVGKDLSLEQAIAKITSIPAKHYGIQNRGLIKEGFIADINLINMSLFQKNIDFDKVRKYQSGIEYQIISGKFSIKEGKFIDYPNGKIIR